MDAFFASVEVKHDAALRGRPVVVGGAGTRGVVASASYEARAFGIRSAMPAAQARRLCPGAVFVAPHFELYHGYSRQIHQIFKGYTPLVEGIGLDEAFLDVSGSRALFGSALEIATQLRRRISDDLALACSVGAGPSKLVAKLASKAAKPLASRSGPVPGRGAVVVSEEDVLGFLWPIPVGALWGVGPASVERLRKLGVATVGELASLPAEALAAALGRSSGQVLYELAWGRDPRPVEPSRPVKSIGHEETYPTDVTDPEELERRLVLMADTVAHRVREHGVVARTVTLKLRYGDFTTLTRSHTFASPQATGPALWTAAKALLGALDLREGVRLLGVSASGLVPVQASPGEQLQLNLGADGSPGPGEGRSVRGGRPGAAEGREEGVLKAERWTRASEAVDAVRARFGEASVRPGVAALSGRVPMRGAPRGRPAS
jgi:DNA polymerase-4